MRRYALALMLLTTAAASAAPTPHWAEVNGHRMYYETTGSGRPLLLLHGGGNSIAGSFPAQIPFFAATHAIVAPEQVGHGHTPDVAGPLTYGGMAEDTAALLKQLHLEDVDVIGWSDGGNVALILAVRYPRLVRRLVVSGANFAPEGQLASDLTALRQRDASMAKDRTTWKIDDKLNHMWATSPTIDELSIPLLGSIRKPVIVMSGDHDAMLLDHTIALYHAIPGARLCVLPGTTHGTFHDRPEWVNAIAEAFFSEK